MTITVLLVEDHAVIRKAMRGLLDGHPRLTVRGEAGTLADGLSMVKDLVPPSDGEHIVLLCDVSLPDGSGLRLAEAARSWFPKIGIVILTMHDDDRTLLEALDVGASALVHKSAPADEVIEAIIGVDANPATFRARGLADALRRSRETPRVNLTARENDVLQLIAGGSSISQVGRALFMSESTVKTHVSKIYAKLGAHNRASAVKAAIQVGLVELSQSGRP